MTNQGKCLKCGGKNIRQVPPEEFDGPFYSILECLDCGFKEFDD